MYVQFYIELGTVPFPVCISSCSMYNTVHACIQYHYELHPGVCLLECMHVIEDISSDINNELTDSMLLVMSSIFVYNNGRF